MALSAGRRVGPFEILSLLGQGGMGEVYRARDTRLGRDVALKLVRGPLPLDETRRARFGREARVVATLNHPAIAAIHDVLEEDDGPVLVMELAEGETLDARLQRGAMPVGQATEVGRQITEALEAAHAKGIIHRDLKPSNVMLTPDGNVKLLDFGVAKALEVIGAAADGATSPTDAYLTGERTVLGTVPYMSPEQLRGEPLDQRTDVWSFGCVLYEMLTGRRPFFGRTRSDTIAAVLGRGPDWRALPRETPGRVRSLLRHCLQKQRDNRIHHIADARIELEDAVKKTGEAAVRVRPEAKASAGVDDRRTVGSRRRRWLWPALAATAIVALLAAGRLLWQRRAPAPAAGARVRIGVLLPRITSSDPATAGWPELTQALFVRELAGIEGLAIVDPRRLNGLVENALGPGRTGRSPAVYAAIRDEKLSYVVDAAFSVARAAYRLQMNVVEPTSGDVRSSRDAVVTSEEGLAEAVSAAAQSLLELLEREGAPLVANRDVRPWLSHGTNSVEAMKAFLQYSAYALRNEPGGTKYLDRAIALDPTFVTARVWRIPGLVEDGEFEQAREEYRTLQRLSPRASAFDQAMIDWVGAYVAGDSAAEVRHLERALAYVPGNNILLVNLAESRLSNDDLEGALKALEPALRMRWRYPGLYTLEGTILVRQQRFAEARRVLQQALEVSPVDPLVYATLGALYRRDAGAAEADRFLRLYVARSGEFGWDPARQQDVLGGCLSSVGLHHDAVAAVRRAVALAPREAAYRVHLCEALRAAARLSEAAEACTYALDLDPRSSPAHKVLGEIREAQGRQAEALVHYEAYLASEPKASGVRQVQLRVEQLRRTKSSVPSRR